VLVDVCVKGTEGLGLERTLAAASPRGRSFQWAYGCETGWRETGWAQARLAERKLGGCRTRAWLVSSTFGSHLQPSGSYAYPVCAL